MLATIEKLLATNEVMTASMLASKAQISTDALAPMMAMLIKRGKVEVIASGDCSGGCGCVANKVEAYRWLGNGRAQSPLNVISVD